MVPFYLVGDGWAVPSGLGRIARDLASVLQVPHLGFHPPALVVERNGDQQLSFSHLGEDWGASSVVEYLAQLHNRPGAPGVLLLVWDPSRAFAYLEPMRRYLPDWELWGYFAVDGTNPLGTLGGPLAVAVRNFDRVTAYTEYGAKVLRQIRNKPVDYLPHGIQIPDGYAKRNDAQEYVWGTVREQLIPRMKSTDLLVGCVATNQPRKDLLVFVQAIHELRERGLPVFGWLHTDELVRHWSIPELVTMYGLERFIRVTTGTLRDDQLYAYYAGCHATICVGRGEGFGYPIVESLACGTPCVAMDYAGGAEITPPQWRYGFQGIDYANLYAIGRPHAHVTGVVNRLQAILEGSRVEQAAYARGSVAHLSWAHLAPRWQAWKKKGLERV